MQRADFPEVERLVRRLDRLEKDIARLRDILKGSHSDDYMPAHLYLGCGAYQLTLTRDELAGLLERRETDLEEAKTALLAI